MLNKQLRLLVIGAHPDDCEYKVGGTAAKFSRLGHKVKFVSATNGSSGHHMMGGSQLVERRRQEALRSADIIGIEYEILDNEDGKLQADLKTRESIICLIREFKPDIIITHRSNDYHPDHRNTSLLVQDSSFLVVVPNICPMVKAIDYQPIILYMSDNFKEPSEFRPDVVIGIDDVIDSKMRMLHCHTSQFYEWLPYTVKKLDQVPVSDDERLKWLTEQRAANDIRIADKYRDMLIERYGAERGRSIKHAEAFQISEYGGQLPKEKISEYFMF